MAALKLEGIFTAFPTPTRKEGSVDESGLRQLIHFLLDNGVAGLVPLGGTGEYTALSPAARARVVAVTVEVAQRRVPVLAGVLSPGYAEAVAAGQAFERLGVDGLMVIAPFYVTPTQAGIRDYFRRYRSEVGVPVLFYDIPYRTGIVTAPETIVAMAKDGSIIGMKACNTDVQHFNRLAGLADASFTILSGEEGLFPTHMALGAKGGVLATSALVPRHWTRIYEAARAGRIAEAVAEQRRLAPLLEAVFGEHNPGPLKEALTMIGIPAGEALPPLGPPSEATVAKLRKAMDGLRAEGIL